MEGSGEPNPAESDDFVPRAEVEEEIQQFTDIIMELQQWISEIGEPALKRKNALDQELSALRKEKDDEIESLKEKNQNTMDELDRAMQKCKIETAQYKGESEQLKKNIVDLKADKADAERDADVRTGDDGNREGVNTELENEVKRLKSQLRKAQYVTQEQGASIAKMAGTIAAMQQSKLEMEQERDKHKAKCRAVERRLEKVHKEYKEKIRILERENKEFNQNIIDLEMEMQMQREQIMAEMENVMSKAQRSPNAHARSLSLGSQASGDKDHHRRTSSLSLLPAKIQAHIRSHSRNLSRSGLKPSHGKNLSRKISNINDILGKTQAANHNKLQEDLTTSLSELMENFLSQQLPLALGAETARVLEEMDGLKTQVQMMQASIGKNIRETMKDVGSAIGGGGGGGGGGSIVPGAADNGPDEAFIKQKVDSLRHVNNQFEKMRTYIRTLEYSRKQDVKTFKDRLSRTPGNTPGGTPGWGNTLR